MQLRRHGLHLRAVEHAHDCRFNDIVEVVPQRDFIAAQFLRLFVQGTAAHPGAEVAGRLVAVVRNIEDIRLPQSPALK